jgi:ligand-binding sensor domain-containing protein
LRGRLLLVGLLHAAGALASWSAFTFFIVMLGSAEALDPAKAVSQYQIDMWSPSEGLPSRLVRSIDQTVDGYIWVTTEGGTARFDGVQFTSFAAPLSRGRRVVLTAAVPSRDGGLWIVTNDSGLLKHDDGVFDVFREPSRRTVGGAQVHEGPDGRVWLGGAEGLFALKGRDLRGRRRHHVDGVRRGWNRLAGDSPRPPAF